MNFGFILGEYWSLTKISDLGLKRSTELPHSYPGGSAVYSNS